MRENRKRRGNRIGRMALPLLIATGLLAGCGAGKEAADAVFSDLNSTSGSYDMGGSSYIEEGYYEGAGELTEKGTAENQPLQEGRKLIETVRLEVETREFDQMMSALETRIQELGGYVESRETYNGSSYSEYNSSRSADLTIRIPNQELAGFLDTVAEVGNIVRRYDHVDDVTLTYVDMESRRDVLRTEQSRLMEFMDKAETVEEIISIEERLSEVRYQLESMESQLRTIDNQVDYSTVEINISEVQELTPMEEPSVWKRISEGFGESLLNIGDGIVEFGIWFVVHIPYLVIWGAVITAIVLFFRKHHRNKKKKLEERLNQVTPAVNTDGGKTDQH